VGDGWRDGEGVSGSRMASFQGWVAGGVRGWVYLHVNDSVEYDAAIRSRRATPFS